MSQDVRRPVFFGELLVDVVFGADGRALCMAGGAPANAAAMCAAQAGAQKPILIASVGDDEFGSWLTRSLVERGVDLAGVRKLASHWTSVAFAMNRRSTNQRFRFYRDADLHISPEQVSCLEAGSLGSLTYGSLSLVPDAPLAPALQLAKSIVKSARLATLLDLNYRATLWPSPMRFRELVSHEVQSLFAVTANLYEARILTGSTSSTSEELVGDIRSMGPELVVVTDGARGMVIGFGTERLHVPAYPREDAHERGDTIGTGDTVAGHLALALAKYGTGLTSDTSLVRSIFKKASQAAGELVIRGGADWAKPFGQSLED